MNHDCTEMNVCFSPDSRTATSTFASGNYICHPSVSLTFRQNMFNWAGIGMKDMELKWFNWQTSVMSSLYVRVAIDKITARCASRLMSFGNSGRSNACSPDARWIIVSSIQIFNILRRISASLNREPFACIGMDIYCIRWPMAIVSSLLFTQ